jgi:threonine dehydratase
LPNEKASSDVHDYIRRILAARIYDVAIESPLVPMPRLSQRLGSPVRLKREDLRAANDWNWHA